MSQFAIPVVRGCGTREQNGAVYAETALCPPGSPHCRPLSFFLIDPPIPVDPDLGISPIGVSLVPSPHPDLNPAAWDASDPTCLNDPALTIWHIFDWVGAQHYPNVADFITEAKFFGISRRLPRTLDFGKLGPYSRLVLLHPRAYVANYHTLWSADNPPRINCPKDVQGHPAVNPDDLEDDRWARGPETAEVPSVLADLLQQTETCDPMCAHIWWHDIDPDSLTDKDRCFPTSLGVLEVMRRLPSTRYRAFLRPKGWVPEYGKYPAIFLSVPIGRLVVTDGEDADGSVERASASGLRVDIVQE